MNTRLTELRKAIGNTQSQFAEKIGMTKNSVYLMEKGERAITERTQNDICRLFNVNRHWLETGEGQMFNDDGDAQAIIDSVMTGDDEFAKKVLVAFAKMPEESWEIIKKLIEEINLG